MTQSVQQAVERLRKDAEALERVAVGSRILRIEDLDGLAADLRAALDALAATQAREAKLREALLTATHIISDQRAGVVEDEPCPRCSRWPHLERCGMPDELSRIANALAEPSDATALREFGERCALKAMRQVNDPNRSEPSANKVAADVVAVELGEKA